MGIAAHFWQALSSLVDEVLTVNGWNVWKLMELTVAVGFYKLFIWISRAECKY